MARIKGLLFDMDGVLIDAKEWHYEALNRALGLFGLEISRYDHLITYDGLPTKKKLEMLSMEKGLPIVLHEFINRLKQKYTLEIVRTKCKPVFCHQYALARLKNEGYRIAVCSNSIRSTIDVMMEHAGLAPYIEFYLSNQDVSKAKPDPEIYLSAMTRIGLAPNECLVVEDNEHGVRAAVASGAHLLKVRDVLEVNYENVTGRIRDLESDQSA